MDILINKTVIVNKLDLVGVIMESIYIDVPRDLTSYEFYNNLLMQREERILAEEQDIILDFSRTFLLCEIWSYFHSNYSIIPHYFAPRKCFARVFGVLRYLSIRIWAA